MFTPIEPWGGPKCAFRFALIVLATAYSAPALTQNASIALPPIVITTPKKLASPRPHTAKPINPIAIRAVAARRLHMQRSAHKTATAAHSADAMAHDDKGAAFDPPAGQTNAQGQKLGGSENGSRWSPTTATGGPAFVQRYQLANPSVASITRQTIDEKINILDSADAVKYMPSLFVRKRNDGDTQAVLQTRTWGVNSSARSLVYADGLLLTALIANDNTIGAPRWGLVTPEEIERVDFLYGPYSAAFPGNSMGGALQITTRMPTQFEASVKQTETVQTFNLWGTNKTYLSNLTNATMGDKINDFSWFLSGGLADIRTQPLTYATTASNYPWGGMVPALNKVGNSANVLGALGGLDAVQGNAKAKFAYDFTPAIRGTYQFGFWSNDANTLPENYIGGYGANSGAAALGSSVMQTFGAGYYRVQEQMMTNSLAIQSATNGLFDFSLSGSNFSYLKSNQISPFSAIAPQSYTQNGKIAKLGGTYWNLFDATGFWRPEAAGKHEVSLGFHADDYHLNNPTLLTRDWTDPNPTAFASATISQGTTRTQALWAQDAWKFHPSFKLTVGGRWENWQARDGYNQQLAGINAYGDSVAATPANISADAPIRQPLLRHTRFSPKGALEWAMSDDWRITGAIGMANRFPTVRELYNLTTLSASSGTVANPNPNLLPEVALTEEIAIERPIAGGGKARFSLFNEEVRDAIVSQNLYVAGTTTAVSANANVGKIRNRGFEIALRKENVFLEGLEIDASATFVDSRILYDPAWAGGSVANRDVWNLSPVGKNANYVPKWRWTVTGTYRPDDHWAFTLATRWQDRMWSTLSNNDSVHGVYGAFDRFFVTDLRIQYKVDEHATFAFGVDNIGDNKYFLYHPFPQRTFTTSGKFKLGAASFNDVGLFRAPEGGRGFLGQIAENFASP